VIRYYLKHQGHGSGTIVITNDKGRDVARLAAPMAAGMNCVVWNTQIGGRARGGRPGRAGSCAYGRPVSTAGARGDRRGGPGRGAPPRDVLEQLAPLGEYTVTLELDGQTLTEHARITATQGWRIGAVPEIIR
jgi:hypothetical protein